MILGSLLSSHRRMVLCQFSRILLFSLSWTVAVVIAQDTTALEKALDKAGVDALFPNESGYANASQPFNNRFNGIHPVAVAYPVGTEQVSAAVKAAAAQNLRVVSRSGGHSYVANGLGGTSGAFVVDLSRNKNITVDNSTGIVTFQTGLRLGDIALTLHDYGRAMPHGRCSYVGVGGHSGHGGYGHHSRMWGLILDVIESVTVVLADGSIKTASENENADLFWALRGSSSSYGIVTEAKAKTFPAPPEAVIFVYEWVSLNASNATTALSSFQAFVSSDIPAYLGGELRLAAGQAEGQVFVQLEGGYWGTHDSFNDTLKPFLDTMPPPDNTTLVIGDWFTGLEAWVYLPMNTSLKLEVMDTYYAKSVFTPEDELMTEEAMESFINYLAHDGFSAPVGWFVEVELYGGPNSAINTVPHDQTAFAHRNALFNFQLYGSSGTPPYPDSAFPFMDGMADSITKAMPEGWNWGSYVGYPDNRLQDWQQLYYKDHYSRLQELKAELDPSNMFRFPLSIEL